VKKGEVIATLYTSKQSSVAEAEKRFLGAISVGEAPPQPHKLIYARVEKDNVVRLEQ
jgi:pyrimidine-nucleoside phosphorylase